MSVQVDRRAVELDQAERGPVGVRRQRHLVLVRPLREVLVAEGVLGAVHRDRHRRARHAVAPVPSAAVAAVRVAGDDGEAVPAFGHFDRGIGFGIERTVVENEFAVDEEREVVVVALPDFPSAGLVDGDVEPAVEAHLRPAQILVLPRGLVAAEVRRVANAHVGVVADIEVAPVGRETPASVHTNALVSIRNFAPHRRAVQRFAAGRPRKRGAARDRPCLELAAALRIMYLLRHAVVHRDDAVLHARPEVADELVLAVFVRVIRLEVVEPAEVVVHRTVVVALDFREILVVRREEIHRYLRVHRRGVRHVGDDSDYVMGFDDDDFTVVFIGAACDMFDVGDDFGAAQIDGAVLHGAVPVDQRRVRHAVEVVRLHDAHDVAIADEPPAMIVVVTRRKQYLLAPVSAEGIDLVLSERALCVVPHARTRHGRGSAGIVAHLQIDGGSAPADHACIDVERAFRLRPFDEIVWNVLRVAGRLRNREGRLAGRDRFVAGKRQRGADLRRAAEDLAGRHLARQVVDDGARRVARERPFHGLSFDRRPVVEFDGGGELRLLARNHLCRAGH